MANSRRAARELALKALFQVEIGRQPREEVLDGVLGQVRITVRDPIAHVLRDAQSEIKAITARYAEGMSSASARRMRLAARGCSRFLITLVDALVGQIDLAVSVSGATGPEAALEQGRNAVGDTRAGLARIASRESLFPEGLTAVTDAAARGADSLVRVFGRHLPGAIQVARFTKKLVDGVLANQSELDAVIERAASGWHLDRLAAVDRNILRLAAYELLHSPGVPPAAAINEAVELAKKYSTAESGRFVNGVLGALPGNNNAKQVAESAAPEEVA